MERNTKWTHVKQDWGMGMEEQWIFRPDVKPLCSLKRMKGGGWTASLLDESGISTTTLSMGMCTLETAKEDCEEALTQMGWRWGAGRSISHVTT